MSGSTEQTAGLPPKPERARPRAKQQLSGEPCSPQPEPPVRRTMLWPGTATLRGALPHRLGRITVVFAMAFVAFSMLAADTEPDQPMKHNPVKASAYFDVRDYGAVGNGTKLDSPAINQAIAACAAAGGGQVHFPPGRYLSGTLHLKSHVTMLFDAGSVLLGSTNLNQYQAFQPPSGTPEGRFRSTWHRTLILGDDLEDITITGQCVIDGNKVFDPQGEEKMRGPHTILLGNCRQVTIRDCSVQDSANYAILLENCQQVQVRNVRIAGGWDGVHFRGWPGRPCRDVTILGCQFYTGDDAIAGRYWENVLISDCIVNSSCNGIRLIGPATHLVIHNCLFYGPGVHPHRSSARYNMLAGINLQPGGWDATQGDLDDVLISDVTMHKVATPFIFTLKPGNTAGSITVNRAAATGVYRAAASVESWATVPFTNVVFRDMSIEYEAGGTRDLARKAIRSPGVDARSLPAWGFYARNVKNLVFDNVRLTSTKDDFRPVLIGEGVQCLKLDAFKFAQPIGAAGALELTNVTQVLVHETDISVVAPRCLALKASPDDASGRFISGKPFSVAVTAKAGRQEGLGKVELTVAEQTTTHWVWFGANEEKAIRFRGLIAPELGKVELKAGGIKETLRVERQK
jgi:hypothetical protein